MRDVFRRDLTWASHSRLSKRTCRSTKKKWLPERDAQAKTRNEFLQLSLRQEGLAWAKIVEFLPCSCAKSTKTIPKTQFNHY